MINIYEELGETSRRQILAELRIGRRSVNELVQATDLKQPNVSNHLARMKSKGIVRSEKVGRQVFYALANTEVEAVVQAVLNVGSASHLELDLEVLAHQYCRSAIAGDEQSCSEIIDAAFRAKATMLDIYQQLITPTMVTIGTWYANGDIDEAQEHMASAITERMLAKTMQVTGPARQNGMSCLLGCAPNNHHVIGLRMISDYLRNLGWRTYFMGANVPTASFVNAVKSFKPDLVLVSCAASEGIPDTLALIAELVTLKSTGGYKIGVGGVAAISEKSNFLDAGVDFLPENLKEFVLNCLPEVH